FVISLALIVFFNFLISLSLPDEFEEIQLNEVSEETKVYQNTTGIKHIIAKNESDAYFMIGFIHARDRLFQMDIKRRTAKGELSEVFGRDYLKIDKYLRTLNLKGIADSVYSFMDKGTIRLLQKYSEGINTFININWNKLPFGFSALDYSPDKWTVRDCIAIQRLFAYEQSIGFKSDLAFGSIAEKTGIDKTLELLPLNNPDASFVLDEYNPDFYKDEKGLSEKSEGSKESPINQFNFSNILSVLNQEIITIKRQDAALQAICGLNSSIPGCNAWAMKKVSNRESSALVANDFHSGLSIPSMWYQLHISYPGVNTIGFSLPGIPFILSGRNNNIAWGITNAMIDDCDYFMEKIDTNPDFYKTSNGEKEKFIFVKDTVEVKNDENHVYYLRSTQRSPVISDFYLPFKDISGTGIDSTSNSVIMNKYVITYSWTGRNISDEMTALYKLTKAKDWSDFKNSFANWITPSLNFVFGDKKGNIGLLTAGAVPGRNEKNNMVLPNPGWLKDFEWIGLDTFGIIGSIYNPPKKYTSAANNALDRDLIYSKYYDLNSRAGRIDELINQYQETENYIYGNIDAQRMQMDILSNYAIELCSRVFPLIEKNTHTLTPIEKDAFQALQRWDYIFSSEHHTPAIFNMFMLKLIENIFKDELGEDGFRYYLSNPSYAYGKTLELLKHRISPWFDNSATPFKESRTYVVMMSFKQAVESLPGLYGSNKVQDWQYGLLHKIEFNNILNNYNFLDPVFSVSEIKRGGDNTTLNYTAWDYFKPFDVTSAPAMRMIADLSDSLVYLSIPGGVSEEPMNPNYSSQLHLWENGGYIQIPVSPYPKDDSQLILICY
ncbi:penicillin acylase family protein, partial [Bacteroidota bacterium]